MVGSCRSFVGMLDSLQAAPQGGGGVQCQGAALTLLL